MMLVIYGEKSFNRWLWKEKDIWSSDWEEPKGSELSEIPYKKLSKQKRRELRKEYFSGVGKSSKYWSIAIILFSILVIYFVVEIILFFHYRVLISRTIGIVTLSIYIVFIYKTSLYGEYWEWLECEKGIQRCHDSIDKCQRIG